MMKKFIPVIMIAAFCTAGLMWSCSKKQDLLASTTGTDGFAFVKIAQFAPNFRGALNTKDSFNIYVNNAKLNGPFLTYGLLFPTVSNLYAAVPAGAVTFKISVVNALSVDSIVVKSFDKTLTAGGYYSFFMTDSLVNANDSKQIFVQDNFTRTDTTHYNIRFAHTILADTAGKNVDVYSNRLAANIFSNISPGTVTNFMSEPYNFVADTLIVRRAGTAFELARISTVATPIARERAYTLVYKGTPVATGTKPRSLTYYPNQ